MKNNYFFYVLICASCVPMLAMHVDHERSTKSFSRIIPIDTYAEVQEVFDTCTPRFLVTFDIDDTLITANDVFARTPEPPFWFKARVALTYLTPFCDTALREEIIDTFLGVFFSQVPRFVFDPDIVRFIRQLQRKRCPVVALSAMGSGAAGCIKKLPEWRYQMLSGFGFDFSGVLSDRVFHNFAAKHGTYPRLYKGILCANYIEKGAVLGALLDECCFVPELIISFDDQKSALESIARACKQRHINFVGYQIRGAKNLPGEWNTSRALLQFDVALHQRRWLSDQEADAALVTDDYSCGC